MIDNIKHKFGGGQARRGNRNAAAGHQQFRARCLTPTAAAPRPGPGPKATKDALSGYAVCIGEACRALPDKIQLDLHAADSLAELDYAVELQAKQAALAEFWRKNKLSGIPEKIIPSPLPRGYRTNSKRRVTFTRGQVALTLEQNRGGPAGMLQSSALEPALHRTIYQLLLDWLGHANYQPLARSLNFCVVRGAQAGCAVILNIHTVDNLVVRKIKQFAAALKNAEPRVISCFMYVDPTRSDYYLESKRPAKGVALKKLFGPEKLDLTVDGLRLLYPPTVFSQVNESMLPHFTGAVRELLQLTPVARLLDLYCGYGLLGLSCASGIAQVIGMDIEGPAIQAAIANARHHFPGRQLKFIAAPITASSLRDKLPPPVACELALLDPPRNGTAPGVIAAVAERCPARALHIFCGTDEIPRELREWGLHGYVPKRILPLDMFPGSTNLETMALLEPKLKD